MRTGQPVPGVTLLISDGSEVFAEVVTGKDGVLQRRDDQLKQSSDLRVFAIHEGHMATSVTSLDGLDFATGLAARGYLYTDRPAYRPGQLVNIRGIVRLVEKDRFTFTPGEEAVYFVFGGVVNLCGRAAPEPQLLERLRKLVIAPASCEGILQPPRPAALAAIEEADPSPYEPLHGFDPELALGVGHVRPVRDDERDDWPRRLKLPLFATPGGELKIWLTPGSVGGDVLVETGYETGSLIVLQARPDGWMLIRFGGPLSSGAGWVHRCHLDAATPRLEYEPWEKRLAGAAPLALRGVLDAVVLGGECGLEEGLQFETAQFALLFASEDMREGTGAFLEKRKPQFRNR